MNRRTILIIVGALVLVALVLASWFWLFSKGSGIAGGLFGGGGSRTGTTTAQSGGTNIQSNIPGGTNAQNGSLTNNTGSGAGGTIVAQQGSGQTNVPLTPRTVAPGGTGSETFGTQGIQGSGSITGGGSIGSGGTISTGGTGAGTVGAGGTVGTGGTVGAGGTTGVSTATSSTAAGGTEVATSSGVATVPGVDWLGGTGAGGSSGAATSNFVPSDINQLNNGVTGGKVTIFGTPPVPNNTSGKNLLAALATAGIGTALCTAGLLGGTTVVGATAGSAALTTVGVAQVGIIKAAAIPGVWPVIDAGVHAQNIGLGAQNVAVAPFIIGDAVLHSNDTFKADFLDCLARTVGRAIVDQITSSVVNWINGGFNGSPSFVQNYQQFFGNVADLAAGSYIQGSALSFLCSPFQLQIKLAIAQSYANRNARSCSLSQVTKNIDNFTRNFNSGGWPAFLSLTTIPTNNPYGAYAYAQVGLAAAQSAAVQNANKSITPGGFISYAQAYNCSAGGAGNNGQLINNSSLFLSPPQAAAGQCPSNCRCKVATPGSIIESSLIGTENSTLNQLNLAKSFDEIISALITQLMTKTLYQGLGNLSGQGGYASNFLTPDQQQAQTQGNALLVQLEAVQQTAQRYGQVEQGSIADIQNAQQQLETLSNCWETITTSSGIYSASQQTQAAAQASTTQASIATLQAQVALYNNNITRANATIVALQSLQTQTLAVTSTADVTAVSNNLNAAAASGQLITAADVTQAQQNRTTLQSQLAATNQQTANNLQLCQATTPI